MTDSVLIARERTAGYALYRQSQPVEETLRTEQQDSQHSTERYLGTVPDRQGIYASIDWLGDQVCHIVTDQQIDSFVVVPIRLEPGLPGEETAGGPGLLATPPPAVDPVAFYHRITGAREVCLRLVSTTVPTATVEQQLRAVVHSWSDRVIEYDPQE